ncbi:pentapeptide repeat-containing protein [Bradyrhizobium liaoningense]|uniref:pentapeptide repeat-containing protein n=1 Tax=Bradyrhizobium liaoningense TaxID=43992 RepID=UPI001BA8D3C9|nr:pentapeptide repeat-containing protein [Bradyrhizobium liaoningense]MBR0711508.1 pentapeptide repeat-containing protein [Bradyrhizobium liaoningense]
MITIVVSIIVFFVLAVFLWFWWFAPRSSVPIHSTEQQLRQLEVQDRLRQTNYQVLTAVGLVATFAISLAQFFETRNHWEADFKTKAEQDRLATFMSAVKLINDKQVNDTSSSKATDDSATNAGVRTLGALGVDDPSSHALQATQILSGFVTSQTRSEGDSLGLSAECKGERWTGVGKDVKITETTRQEANSAVQGALRSLGDAKMAAYRQHVKRDRCVKPTAASQQLRLEHAGLDNLDLSGLDLSCSMLSQAKFRRTSLNSAKLAYSDLRGARFADYDIKNSPSQRADGKPAISGAQLYSRGKDGDPDEWQVYRCWISDLRYANLRGAQLEGTAFDGADLREADFSGAKFSRTDLSRANLTGAYGLTKDMLKHSCAGIAQAGRVDVNAQPVGLSSWIGQGRLTPCATNPRHPADPSGGDKVGSEDLPTTEEVQKTDAENEEKLRNRSLWSAFVEEYGEPLIAPLAAIFAALAFFQFVGIYSRRTLVPASGVLRTLPVRFPEKSLQYSASQLELFVRTNPDLVRIYCKPILFPLDVIVMSGLAGASAYASWTWLSYAGVTWPAYCLIFPLLYWAADLVEDVWLRRYLQGAEFDEITIGRLKMLTLAKMTFVAISFLQTVICFVIFVQR